MVMMAEGVDSMEPVSAEVATVGGSVHPAYDGEKGLEGDIITTLL